jgi:TrkA domain protein
MPEVTEIRLPGVGVRHEFTTDGGERVGVLSHRDGRREVLLYEQDDPDRCTTVLHLSPEDGRTLAELLGATQVSETIAEIQQRVEGLAIEWLTLPARSQFVGATIADGQFRTRTGASIVAVVRGDTTIAAPGPDHEFHAGDVIVAVGTMEGLRQVRELVGA